MNLLFLDCTYDWIIVSTFSVEENEVTPIQSFSGHFPKESSFRFVGDIQSILEKSNISKPDCILACIGPGSFTGVRISVATARNFSQIWRIPVMGVDSIELYSSSYYLSSNKPSIVILDGKMSKFYIGCFSESGYKGSYDLAKDEFGKYFTESELNYNLYSNCEIFPNSKNIISELPNPEYWIQKNVDKILSMKYEDHNYSQLIPNYIRGTYVD